MLPLFLLTVVPPALASLVARDVPIGTLVVPLTLSSDNRYLSQVHMGTGGSTVQTFNFTVATSLGYSIVAAQSCSTCASSSTYDSSKSQSEQNIGTAQSVSLGNTLAQGSLIRENCTLQQKNGSTWAYPNQLIVSVVSTNSTSTDSIFTSDASGIFGLGLTGTNLSFQDTIFGGFFHRNPNTPSFSYGMALQPPQSASSFGPGSAGRLDWLSPDSTAYIGNLTTAQVTTQSVPQNSLTGSTDWTVSVTGWTLNTGTSALVNSKGALATVDPYFPEIYLPFSEATSIYALIPGAVPTTRGDFVEWTVPCSTEMTWALVFNSVAFPVPSTTLVVARGSTCVGSIRGWSNQVQEGYLLGSSFISAIYLVFSVNSGNSQPATMSMGQRSDNPTLTPTKSTPIGAIVGGTVGGVILIALVGLAIWFLLRRNNLRKNSAYRVRSDKPLEKVDPFMSPPTTAGYSGHHYQPYVDDANHDGPAQYVTVSDSSRYAAYNQSSLGYSGAGQYQNLPPTPPSAITITQRAPTVSPVQYSPPAGSDGRQDFLSMGNTSPQSSLYSPPPAPNSSAVFGTADLYRSNPRTEKERLRQQHERANLVEERAPTPPPLYSHASAGRTQNASAFDMNPPRR